MSADRLIEPPIAAAVQDPAALRAELERRGPLFVKLGQFLSMRPDLIDRRYCDELMRLVDRGPIMPWTTVSRIIAEDLGRPPEDIFAVIDPEPIVAASLAQVHAARTTDGREVAVKVLRAGIREAVAQSLADERTFTQIWNATGATSIVDAPTLLAEFRRWLDEELDTSRELHNLKRLRRLSRRSRVSMIPRGYPRLSGPRIVTQTLLTGVPFSELLRMQRDDRVDRIARLGFDTDRLAARLIATVLTQVFRYQFFHADIHPGNLIALPGDVVGLVDLGLCDVLDPSFRRGLLRYLGAVYEGDTEAMYRGLLEVLVIDDRADVDGFREDFYDAARRWLRDRDLPRQDGDRRSPIADYLISTLRAARRRGLRVPASLLSMYRALLSAETIANELGANADLRQVGRRFFARLRRRELWTRLSRDRRSAWLADMSELILDGPSQLRQLLLDWSDDRLTLTVRTVQSPDDRASERDRARLVALAVVLVALSVLLVGAERIPAVAGLVRGVTAVALAAAATYMWLLWRRLR